MQRPDVAIVVIRRREAIGRHVLEIEQVRNVGEQLQVHTPELEVLRDAHVRVPGIGPLQIVLHTGNAPAVRPGEVVPGIPGAHEINPPIAEERHTPPGWTELRRREQIQIQTRVWSGDGPCLGDIRQLVLRLIDLVLEVMADAEIAARADVIRIVDEPLDPVAPVLVDADFKPADVTIGIAGDLQIVRRALAVRKSDHQRFGADILVVARHAQQVFLCDAVFIAELILHCARQRCVGIRDTADRLVKA